MPQPIATWNPARGVWETTERSLLCGHSVPYSETWPPSGMTHAGVAYALATWEHRTSGSGSLSLLPTPTAGVFNDGEDVENWLARREAHKAKGRKFMSLSVAVALLSTLQATNGTKGGPNQRGSSGDLMLPSAVQALLPTPQAQLGEERNQNIWVRDPSQPQNLQNALARILTGESTNQPSDGGNTSSDAPHQHPTNPGREATPA